MNEQNSRFVGEEVTALFDTPPQWSKSPPCPNRIIWQDKTYEITTLHQEWRDYERRGRMASNMRPENAQRARQRGSWGVGRFYFRVTLDHGRVFDLYYDRAPKGSDQRLGSWYLYRELIE